MREKECENRRDFHQLSFGREPGPAQRSGSGVETGAERLDSTHSEVAGHRQNTRSGASLKVLFLFFPADLPTKIPEYPKYHASESTVPFLLRLRSAAFGWKGSSGGGADRTYERGRYN